MSLPEVDRFILDVEIEEVEIDGSQIKSHISDEVTKEVKDKVSNADEEVVKAATKTSLQAFVSNHKGPIIAAIVATLVALALLATAATGGAGWLGGTAFAKANLSFLHLDKLNTLLTQSYSWLPVAMTAAGITGYTVVLGGGVGTILISKIWKTIKERSFIPSNADQTKKVKDLFGNQNFLMHLYNQYMIYVHTEADDKGQRSFTVYSPASTRDISSGIDVFHIEITKAANINELEREIARIQCEFLEYDGKLRVIKNFAELEALAKSQGVGEEKKED